METLVYFRFFVFVILISDEKEMVSHFRFKGEAELGFFDLRYVFFILFCLEDMSGRSLKFMLRGS